MKQELTKEDIYFLARVKKIEVEHLLKMRTMLDPKRVRSILIRYEYRERAKIRKIAKRDIITLLMKRYDVSRSYIEAIVYEKPNNLKRKKCLNCGEEISYYRWTKNLGLCDICASNKQIDNTINDNTYGETSDASEEERGARE